MVTAHLKQFLEDLELPFADDKRSRNQLKTSLIIGVQFPWLIASKIHREHDI
jgi:hypothetical protein